MARDQNDSEQQGRQFHWRTRLCLLKGCEQPFRPTHPRSRYCSSECCTQARRWSRKRAHTRYRKTAKGKERRRLQLHRYRLRQKQRVTRPQQKTKEGDPNEIKQGVLCSRAGCYERVYVDRRSPLKKYCCSLCYRAVRRVIERERRWLYRVRARSPHPIYGFEPGTS